MKKNRSFQELLTDFNTAKRLSAENGEPLDAFLDNFIKARWTRDEIKVFASDFLALSRRDEYDAFKEWLRDYWEKQLHRIGQIEAYSKAQSANAKARNRALECEESAAASREK